MNPIIPMFLECPQPQHATSIFVPVKRIQYFRYGTFKVRSQAESEPALLIAYDGPNAVYIPEPHASALLKVLNEMKVAA